MTNLHIAKGDTLFLPGTSLIVLCAWALFFILVAWVVWGSDFKDSFFGDTIAVVLGTGVIAGSVIATLPKSSDTGTRFPAGCVFLSRSEFCSEDIVRHSICQDPSLRLGVAFARARSHAF